MAFGASKDFEMKMRSLVFLTSLAWCVASSAAEDFFSTLPQAKDHPGDYQGRCVDFDTGRPIEGVVVVLDWYVLNSSPIAPGSRGGELFKAAEGATDSEGRFVVPDLGKSALPPLFKQDFPSFPRFFFFKPGYVSKNLQRSGWDSGFTPLGEPNNPPALTARHDPALGTLVALVPVGHPSTQPDNRNDPALRRTAPSELSVAMGAAGTLQDIVRRARESTVSGGRDRVMEDLRGAFLAVDTEIRRLTGKRHGWHPAIRAFIESQQLGGQRQ